MARGVRSHNLFGRAPESVLGDDVDDVRAYVGG